MQEFGVSDFYETRPALMSISGYLYSYLYTLYTLVNIVVLQHHHGHMTILNNSYIEQIFK